MSHKILEIQTQFHQTKNPDMKYWNNKNDKLLNGYSQKNNNA